MLNGKKIAVVVPSYNEESQIEIVLNYMPDFVDRIIVVNDNSKDKTREIVLNYINNSKKSELGITNMLLAPIKKTLFNYAEIQLNELYKSETILYAGHKIENAEYINDRVILISHTSNSGVGAAIATGYKWCRDHDIDCTAVMAGDAQMDPEELINICSPVVNDDVDYVKGNRLIHKSASIAIPKVRYFGNSILSILTKVASGYWHISDTQTGYTAISKSALNSIRLYDIYKSYGMPNDLLVKLNVAFCTLKEIEIKPVYNVGENSKMKIFKVVPKVSWLLVKSFFKRLWGKYLFRDFHPLFLLYNMSFLLGLASLYYGIKILYLWITMLRPINELTILAFIFLSISAFQSLLFAMWMDMLDNERLYK